MACGILFLYNFQNIRNMAVDFSVIVHFLTIFQLNSKSYLILWLFMS